MAKRGAETDPSGKAGAADWTAEFLTLGTTKRNQLELARDIEAKGATLAARGGWDAVLVNLEGLAEDCGELLTTLAEVNVSSSDIHEHNVFGSGIGPDDRE